MTDQQPEDDRIMLEEVPLVIEVNYHNGGEEPSEHIALEAGCEPFILFRMKQADGAIVLSVEASLIETEDDLIETLEGFFETMLEDRMQRGLINLDEIVAEVAAIDDVEDLPEHNEQGEYRDV